MKRPDRRSRGSRFTPSWGSRETEGLHSRSPKLFPGTFKDFLDRNSRKVVPGTKTTEKGHKNCVGGPVPKRYVGVNRLVMNINFLVMLKSVKVDIKTP